MGLLDLQKRWMMCMRLSTWPMIVSITGSITYTPFVLLAANTFGLGIYGFGLVMFFTNLVELMILNIYMRMKDDFKDAVFLPRIDSFKAWGEYLSIAIPSACMICAEWWYFEILVILAGNMGVLQLDAQAIIMSTCGMLTMVALGMQSGIVALLGNAVGANNINAARQLIKVITTLNVMIFGAMCFFAILFRYQIATIFTNDEEIIAILGKAYMIRLFFFFFDGIQCYMAGIIRALGK